MANEQPHPHVIYKQPQSLLKCASSAIGFIITKPALDIFNKCEQTDHISAEDRRYMESCIMKYAEFFDSYIPRHLHDIVTQHSLQCLPFRDRGDLAPETYGVNYLDIILRSDTKRLDAYECPYVFCNALYQGLQRLKYLQYLKLRSANLIKNLDHVTGAIKRMKNLDLFDCPYCCDEVVKVLSDNCPLRKLDINFSFRVTDVSLPYILNLRMLKDLNILHCGLSKKSEFQILSGLPQLTTISCSYLESFLAQINDDSVKMPFQSVRYFCFTPKDIVNLTKYCPYIMDLHISVTQFLISSPGNDLSGLAALNHLKKLNVYSSNYIELTKIKPLLKAKGHQLIELEISVLGDDSTRTLNEIRRLCPNLKSFTVNNSC